MSRADGGGGRKTLCIKIHYSEPRGAVSREGSSTLAESSRVLDSDWLMTRVTKYSNLIGCRLQCIEIGYSSAQCIKIGYSSGQYIKIGNVSAQYIKIGFIVLG